MAFRASLTHLIEFVRREIGDDAVGGAFLSDDLIAQALDAHKQEAIEMELAPVAKRNLTTKKLEQLVFTAPFGFWEKGAVLTNADFDALTAEPATNLLEGRFVFEREQETVFISGFYFDVWTTCADLCEMWAARVASDVDFSDGGLRFAESQLFAHLMKLSASFRARAQKAVAVGTGALLNSDFTATIF